MMRCRLRTELSLHPPSQACSAASTALVISSCVDSGTFVRTLCVDGSWTSICLDALLVIHSPLIYSLVAVPSVEVPCQRLLSLSALLSAIRPAEAPFIFAVPFMKLTFEFVENAREADSADVLDSVTDDDDTDDVESVLLVADDDVLRLTILAPEMQRRITYCGRSERCSSDDALQERTTCSPNTSGLGLRRPRRLVSGSAEPQICIISAVNMLLAQDLRRMRITRLLQD